MLQHLQKVFRIRNCRDSFFANRSRPCLQYQIGRCSAPCVGLIDAPSYARDVEGAIGVLEGRNAEVIAELQQRMEGRGTVAAVRGCGAAARSAARAAGDPRAADRRMRNALPIPM